MDIIPTDETVEAGDLPKGDIIPRDVPDAPADVAAHISRWQEIIKRAEKFWCPVFRRIEEEIAFVSGKQWPGQTLDDDQYKANIIQRHINQSVAQLYAKNPTFVCRRKPKLDFAMWDGNQVTLQGAMMESAAAAQMGMMPSPESAAIMADYRNGMARKKMLDAVARTLELVFEHDWNQQQPSSKSQSKALVRRVKTARVGYLKIGYQRETDPTSLRASSEIPTWFDRAQKMAQLAADIVDGQLPEDSPEAVELKAMTQAMHEDMQSGENVVTREGLVFDYPQTTAIIVDPDCTNLQGFVGANWVCERYLLCPSEVKAKYGKDVKTGATIYSADGSPKANTSSETHGEDKVCLWEIYDKVTQLCFVICDGYKDYIKPPGTPQPTLERFWPWQALVFNPVEVEVNKPEDDVTIYPPSDVRLLMPIQQEINRSREAVRSHRISNRPAYAAARNKLDKIDKDSLIARPANAVIEMSMAPGERIADILQPLPTVPLDPMLYDTSQAQQDMLLVVGAQEANLGTAAGATATETQIAEASRLTSTGSNVDELDDFLTEAARVGGEVLLMESSVERAKQIAGPGGAWPQFNREEIKKELYLEVQAASAGKPNRSQEVANFRELAPLLMQFPNINPEALAREGIRRLDDRLELEDFYLPNTPPISSMGRPAPAPEAPSKTKGGEQPDDAPPPQNAPQAPNDMQAMAAVDAMTPGF